MTNQNILALKNDPAYSVPGVSKGLFSVFNRRFLLSLLINKGTQTRYYGSVLGWVWSYIKPGMQFLMYFLVIGILMGANRDIPFYHIYLFTGIVTINLFTETLANTTNSITDNKDLVRKIFLPRELFPVSACGVALIHFLPQAVVLLIVALFSGWRFDLLAIASFVLGILILVTFALGLGLFFGALNALYRDAQNIVEIFLMFATWMSPVLYSWKLVKEQAPDWFYNLYMCNPVTIATELFHRAFLAPLGDHLHPPEGFRMFIIISVGISLLTVLIGQLTFKKLEGEFAQRL